MNNSNNTAAKHTPGPWVSHESTRCLATGNQTGFWIEDFSGQIIAHVRERDDLTQEQNANLIAAAPCLLEACKNAANVLAGLATGQLKTIDKDSPALAQLRSAIAKAQGGAK